MAELMAIREALSWLKTLNFRKVIFESDCEDVIDAYNSSRHDLSEFRLVLQDCLTSEVKKKKKNKFVGGKVNCNIYNNKFYFIF